MQKYEQEYTDTIGDISDGLATTEKIAKVEEEIMAHTHTLVRHYRIIDDTKSKIAELESTLKTLKQQTHNTTLLRAHAAHLVYTAYKEYNTLIWMCQKEKRDVPHLPESITNDPFMQA